MFYKFRPKHPTRRKNVDVAPKNIKQQVSKHLNFEMEELREGFTNKSYDNEELYLASDLPKTPDNNKKYMDALTQINEQGSKKYQEIYTTNRSGDEEDPYLSSGSEYIPPQVDESSSVESDGPHSIDAEECFDTVNNKQVENNSPSNETGSSSSSSSTIENMDYDGNFFSANDIELPVSISTNKENKATTKVVPCLGKRSDKKQCCKFCLKLVIKLPRHLMSCHADKLEVIKFMKLKPNDKERRNIIERIRNNGNFIYNYKYGNDANNFIVKRRPPVNEKSSTEYLPCQYCHATVNNKHNDVVNYFCASGFQKMDQSTYFLNGITYFS